jgi:hypothetical protein
MVGGGEQLKVVGELGQIKSRRRKKKKKKKKS